MAQVFTAGLSSNVRARRNPTQSTAVRTPTAQSKSSPGTAYRKLEYHSQGLRREEGMGQNS